MFWWSENISETCLWEQSLLVNNMKKNNFASSTWLSPEDMGKKFFWTLGSKFLAKKCFSNQLSTFEGCFTLFNLHSPLNKGASPFLKDEWTYARAYSPFCRVNVFTIKGETPFLNEGWSTLKGERIRVNEGCLGKKNTTFNTEDKYRYY